MFQYALKCLTVPYHVGPSVPRSPPVLTHCTLMSQCTLSCLTISSPRLVLSPWRLKNTPPCKYCTEQGGAAVQQGDYSGNYVSKPGGGGGEGVGSGMGQDAARTRSLPTMTMELSGHHSGRRSHRPAGTPLRAPAFPTVSFPPSMMLKVWRELLFLA